MNYPLNLSFKILALAPQIHLTDSEGSTVCYVRQKMFKLKEAVQVFSDTDRSTELCAIKADRILDISACYRFTNPDGKDFGGVKRRGLRSIFKAHYDVLDGEEIVAEVKEANMWAKFFDGIFGQIPLIGFLSSYLFHPTYIVSRTDGTELLSMKKRPAFWEGKFQIEKLADLERGEEMRCFMALVMITLLERDRG